MNSAPNWQSIISST